MREEDDFNTAPLWREASPPLPSRLTGFQVHKVIKFLEFEITFNWQIIDYITSFFFFLFYKIQIYIYILFDLDWMKKCVELPVSSSPVRREQK